MSLIISENHSLTFFHIYPQPDSFIPGNDYGTRIHFEKDLKDQIPLIFVVRVEVQQIVENRMLCVCNSLSEFQVSISKSELLQFEQWNSLVRRSIRACNKLYKEKVIDTYLAGTDVPLPE